MSLRILLVDDQALVRSGFRMLVEVQPGMEVVGEAANGEEAVAEARRTRPDVVLMDIRMPRMDGIEATRLITRADASPGCRVLLLTTYDLDEYVFRGLRAGASGFLLKDVAPEDLVRAIHVVAEGESLLSPSITRRLIEEFVRTPEAPPMSCPELASLTEREHEVLTLMGRGLANQEIAERLSLSMATVKTHVNRVFSKLRLRDRAQAVVVAYETGIVRPRDAGPAGSRPEYTWHGPGRDAGPW
ncbi:response regulator [Streptosporangium sp. NPDC000396]|uniref:response regulator n=1 Tax=Streptosporangium sp. NPDC000396 TaxID=3366185 RepID=UPI00368D3A6D